MSRPCKAYKTREGWKCDACGTYGDHDDRPECLTEDEIAENALAAMRRIVGTDKEKDDGRS